MRYEHNLCGERAKNEDFGLFIEFGWFDRPDIRFSVR